MVSILIVPIDFPEINPFLKNARDTFKLFEEELKNNTPSFINTEQTALDELIKITRTKFVIVTHHALTMSKMNRLYGVTMPEKGISQLVAVDLQKAEEFAA